MKTHTVSMITLLAVISVSIVFGMILGGKLVVPREALAAPATLSLSPPAIANPAITSFADIVERAMPAVVSVRSTRLREGADESRSRWMDNPLEFFFGEPQQRDPRERQNPEPRIGEGSGFFISADGYLLTNNHVVENADRVVATLQDGTEFDAEVIGTDPSIDLALLKIDPGNGKFPSLPLGDSSKLRVGEWVLAIGNPLEYEHTVTVGVLSAKERRVAIGSTDAGVVSFLQTDAAINFGNSGGPLIDGRGNVVGINTAITRVNYAEGIGFALPINHARSVVGQLKDTGHVRRGFIGITMNQTDIDEATREYYGLPDRNGVIVREVQEDGPAEVAGLRVGDIIRTVDGELVKNNQDLVSKISSHQPDEKVQIEVFRNGKIHKFEATLVDRNREQLARAGAPDPEFDEPGESSGMGITVENLDSAGRRALGLEGDQRGVLVTAVEYDSEAADKGIQRHMVIIAVNDRPTPNVVEWDVALAELSSGDVAKLDVLAGNRGSYYFLRVPD